MVFIFSVLDGKRPFWANYLDLPKVSKIKCLRQSALKNNYSTVPRQIVIKKIFFSHYKNAKPIIKRIKHSY